MRTISLIPVSDNVFNYANYQIVHNSDRWSWSQLCQCKCQVRWYLQMILFRNDCHMWWNSNSWNVPVVWKTMTLDNIWHWRWRRQSFHCFGVNRWYEYVQWYKDDNVMSGRVTLNLPTCTFYPWSQPTRLWYLNSFWWFNGTLFFWTPTVIFMNILFKKC